MAGKRKVEVLAPAGSYDSMTAAFAAGADAAYIGGSRFGARAYADNPDEETLCRAIDYAHLHGRRLYMTVNTLVKEQELVELPDYLRPYYERGLDGVIVQDLGVVALIKQYFPDLPVHASTQMTITSAYGAKLLKEMGVTRVVAARELSLEEIRQIKEQAQIEVECFVHGALCYSYSGQCLMSSLIGGRSGNRGRCAQPCRLPYGVWQSGCLVSGSSRHQDGDIRRLDPKEGNYILNLKDMCTLDLIPELLEAGIDSLKIEGRMKSPRYTAGVTSMYRKYVDRYMEVGGEGYQVSPEDRKHLLELFDRGGFSQGYYHQHNGKDMVALKEKPAFREGNPEYFQYLDQTYVGRMLQEPVKGRVVLEPEKEASLTLSLTDDDGDEITVRVLGTKVQRALKQPMTRDKVERQLKKTGNTPFTFEKLDVAEQNDIFLPVQALNELRRKGLEALEEKVLEKYSRFVLPTAKSELCHKEAGLKQEMSEICPLLTVSLEEPEQFGPAAASPEVAEIYLDSDGFPAKDWKEYVDSSHKAGKKCYLALPHIFRKEALDYFQKKRRMLLEAGFDGMIVKNLEEAGWLKELGKGEKLFPMIFDASCYAWNHLSDRMLRKVGADRITMPVELNSRELMEKGCEGQELLVYGALPMMVSAQCIQKTAQGCSGRRGVLTLKDRTGKLMPVKNHCTFCYNTIYNASPLNLLGMEKVVERLKPGAVRLAFTTEDPDTISRLLEAFAASFCRATFQTAAGRFRQSLPTEMTDGNQGNFTRGHIKRGVE